MEGGGTGCLKMSAFARRNADRKFLSTVILILHIPHLHMFPSLSSSHCGVFSLAMRIEQIRQILFAVEPRYNKVDGSCDKFVISGLLEAC